MKRKLLIAAAVVGVALMSVPAAAATWSPVALSQVASAFASRDVNVICESEAEDQTLTWAWGYVWEPTGQQNETYIHEYACAGALAIQQDLPYISDRQKAVGAEVLVHESYHLKRVPNNQSEAITECRAMRHFDVVLSKLGASEDEIKRLIPLMLLDHYRLGAYYPEYYKKMCGIPKRYYKYIGRNEDGT